MKISLKIGWPYPTWPQRTASLQRRAPQGLARKQRASPGAQRKPTESEVTPCLQILFACFGRFEILEFVQCWVLFVSGCFYVFLQFNFPLASDLSVVFASSWCFFCFFCFFWLLRHRTCLFYLFGDCKGYIMWHTNWDAHLMVQEESPGRMSGGLWSGSLQCFGNV